MLNVLIARLSVLAAFVLAMVSLTGSTALAASAKDMMVPLSVLGSDWSIQKAAPTSDPGVLDGFMTSFTGPGAMNATVQVEVYASPEKAAASLQEGMAAMRGLASQFPGLAVTPSSSYGDGAGLRVVGAKGDASLIMVAFTFENRLVAVTGEGALDDAEDLDDLTDDLASALDARIR